MSEFQDFLDSTPSGWGDPVNSLLMGSTHWWLSDGKAMCHDVGGSTMFYLGPTYKATPLTVCQKCIAKLSLMFEEGRIRVSSEQPSDGLQNPKRDAFRQILNLIQTLENIGVGDENIVRTIKDACRTQGNK